MSNDKNIRSLAILGYHKIGPPSPGGWESWYYVPEATFLSQLRWLCDQGWQFISAAALLRGLDEPASLPERAALVTFDDGYRSTLTVALPCLRQFDCPAALFLPTDFIGGSNTFDQGMEPTEPICNWDDLRVLERNGVSVQSHTASHRWLSQLDVATQTDELRRSKAVLEAGLNKRIELLSYPYGDAATDIAAVRRAGYRAAFLFSGDGRVNRGPVTDMYRMPRIAMGPDTDLKAFLEQR